MKKILALSIALFSIKSGAPVMVVPTIPEAERVKQSLQKVEQNSNEHRAVVQELKTHIKALERKAYHLQDQLKTCQEQARSR